MTPQAYYSTGETQLPSNPRQTLYNPPIVAGAAAVASGSGESQRRTSAKVSL